jgi:hypothetical protein
MLTPPPPAVHVVYQGASYANRADITSFEVAHDVKVVAADSFSGCTNLTSVGKGFSPECYVHPFAFRNCPKPKEAATDKGYDNVEAWGKAVWWRRSYDSGYRAA